MKTKIIFFLFLIPVLVSLYSCLQKKQNSTDKPVKIIFDTDMGSDCDDVGALALLNVYADMSKVQILGCIYSSGKVPYGSGIVDAINTYYGRPDIPVGADYDDEVGDPVDKMTAEKLAKDTAAYKNDIIHNNDAEEQTRLCRKLLEGQDDGSVTYITVGHTKCLYDLLVSAPDDVSPLNGTELVKLKIHRWIALGALNANNKEGKLTKDWNFFFNNTAPYTEYLIDNFPNQVVFIGTGSEIMTGESLKKTPPGNIIRTAYRDWLWNVQKKTLDDQRPSWDIIAVYYAVEDIGKFLKEEQKGWLEFDAEKGCRWNLGESNFQHSYITLKKGISEQFKNYLNEMIAKQPTL